MCFVPPGNAGLAFHPSVHRAEFPICLGIAIPLSGNMLRFGALERYRSFRRIRRTSAAAAPTIEKNAVKNVGPVPVGV